MQGLFIARASIRSSASVCEQIARSRTLANAIAMYNRSIFVPACAYYQALLPTRVPERFRVKGHVQSTITRRRSCNVQSFDRIYRLISLGDFSLYIATIASQTREMDLRHACKCRDTWNTTGRKSRAADPNGIVCAFHRSVRLLDCTEPKAAR